MSVARAIFPDWTCCRTAMEVRSLVVEAMARMLSGWRGVFAELEEGERDKGPREWV